MSIYTNKSQDQNFSLFGGKPQDDINNRIFGSDSKEKQTIFNIGKEYIESIVTGWKTGRVSEEYLEVYKGRCARYDKSR